MSRASDDIGEIMERWARWRHYRAKDELGIGECMTGKLFDGIPKVPCTDCAGKGKKMASVQNVMVWLECRVCGGDGIITPSRSGVRVNPKLIRATGWKYADGTSIKVDRLYCNDMALLHKLVVAEEYWWSGPRSTKEDRIGIGRYLYERTLREAHDIVRFGLVGLKSD